MDSTASATPALLAKAQAGDADAYGELCQLYETRLLQQAFALCGNAAAAEDLAEDTLVEGWRCIRLYNGRCQFFTWLCAILINRYRNTVRRNRNILVSDLPEEQASFRNADSSWMRQASPPDEVAANQDEARLLRACMQNLSAKHQRVLYLRFYVDESLEGIAAAMGCSVGTVKSRLFHALNNLRSMRALNGQSLHSIRSPSHL